MTPQLQAALLRAVLVALGAFLTSAVTAYTATGSANAALAAGLAAALATLGIRGGAEGLYDSHRAATGKVQASDVGQQTGFGG